MFTLNEARKFAGLKPVLEATEVKEIGSWKVGDRIGVTHVGKDPKSYFGTVQKLYSDNTADIAFNDENNAYHGPSESEFKQMTQDGRFTLHWAFKP